jgi:hypothetical protein
MLTSEPVVDLHKKQLRCCDSVHQRIMSMIIGQVVAAATIRQPQTLPVLTCTVALQSLIFEHQGIHHLRQQWDAL